MSKISCAISKRRALAIVLSLFFITGIANTSYAYTVDDLREFTGNGHLGTEENRALLASIILEYGRQKNVETVLGTIEDSNINNSIIENYNNKVNELEEINSNIEREFNSSTALEIISLVRSAETTVRDLDKFNLNGIEYTQDSDEITDEEYNQATLNYNRALEIYELGIIGNGLTKIAGSEAFRITRPFGDSLDDNMAITHSNGLYVHVSENEGVVRNLWNGVVEKVVDSEEWGKYIVVRHGDNLSSSISFLSEVNVIEGQELKQFDIVGKSTNQEIYIELILDGEYIDPIYVFGSDGVAAYYKWASENAERVIEYKDYSDVKNEVESLSVYTETDTEYDNNGIDVVVLE